MILLILSFLISGVVAEPFLTGIQAPTNNMASLPQKIAEHVPYQALRVGVNAAVNLAAEGHLDGESLARGFAANVAGATCASTIGNAYYAEQIGGVAHKIWHGLSGAAMGGILKGSRGMLPGAFGAMVAETVAETLLSDQDLKGMMDAHYTQDQIEERLRFTSDVARMVTLMGAAAVGITDVETTLASATNALDNNFSQTHQILDEEEDLIDEETLDHEAHEKGISQAEQDALKAKLQALSQERLGRGQILKDLMGDIATKTPEFMEATKKSLLKGYVQKIAAVNHDMKQLLAQHPWAKETLTTSLHLFTNCVRAMLYIDVASLGAAGATGLCVAQGVKDPRGLLMCGLLGRAAGMVTTAVSIEPALEIIIHEGVSLLSNSAAETWGDTPFEREAIANLVGDMTNMAGVVMGARYLTAHLGNPLGKAASGAGETAALKIGDVPVTPDLLPQGLTFAEVVKKGGNNVKILKNPGRSRVYKLPVQRLR